MFSATSKAEKWRNINFIEDSPSPPPNPHMRIISFLLDASLW